MCLLFFVNWAALCKGLTEGKIGEIGFPSSQDSMEHIVFAQMSINLQHIENPTEQLFLFIFNQT